MRRIIIAVRAFWGALASAFLAEQFAALLEGQALPKGNSAAKSPQTVLAPEATSAPRGRSDAITLLSALQREARFVDLVKQPLGQFTDEQIGAAARNVLGDCAVVLDRFFTLQAVVASGEGAECQVTSGYDPAEYKLAGAASGPGPFRGQLVHPGWRAAKVALPTWTGSSGATLVISPAEVEVRPGTN